MAQSDSGVRDTGHTAEICAVGRARRWVGGGGLRGDGRVGGGRGVKG